MSCVPLPWCTSKSTTATRRTPQRARACSAAMAAEPNKQNPIARRRSAWCPGGRVATKAARAQPSITASTAAAAPPAARDAASRLPWPMAVSPSSRTCSPGGGWIARMART